MHALLWVFLCCAAGVAHDTGTSPQPTGIKGKAFSYLTRAADRGSSAAQASLESLEHSPERESSTQRQAYHVTYSTSMNHVCSTIQGIPHDGESLFFVDADYVCITPPAECVFSRPNGQYVCSKVMESLSLTPERKAKLVELMITRSPYVLMDGMDVLVNMATSKGLKRFVLTRLNINMSINPATWRAEQLKQLGLVFHHVENKSLVEWDLGGQYDRGIIRAGAHSKGAALEHFIRHIYGKIPNRIIFVDNNLWYVKSVGHACQRLGVDFYGIHFVSDTFANDIMPLPRAVQFQLETLEKEERIPGYQEALSRASPAPEEPLCPEDALLKQEWNLASRCHSSPAARSIMKKAQDGNALAQAYAACLYYQGISSAPNVNIAIQHALICARALRESESHEEVQYIIGHMLNIGIFPESQVESVNPSTQVTYDSQSIVGSQCEEILTPQLRHGNSSTSCTMPSWKNTQASE